MTLCDNYCDGCSHYCMIKGAQRGVMDCDPDEFYCSANMEDFFYTNGFECNGDDEFVYDDDGERITCPRFEYAEEYDDDGYYEED